MNEFFGLQTGVWSRVIHGFNHMDLGMALWLGFALLTIVLLVLMATRWGHVKPLWKCVALSLLAHVLLGGYAYGTRLIFTLPAVAEGEPIQLKLVELDQEKDESTPRDTVDEAWDQFDIQSNEAPPISEVDRAAVRVTPITRASNEPRALVQPENFSADLSEKDLAVVQPPNNVDMRSTAHQIGGQSAPPEEITIDRQKRAEDDSFVAPQTDELARMDVADTQVARPLSPVPDNKNNDRKNLDQLFRPSPDLVERAAVPQIGSSKPAESDAQPAVDDKLRWGQSHDRTQPIQLAAARRRLADGKPMPKLYQRRLIDQRLQSAVEFGGGPDTERAVQAALRWLRRNQERDGRWSAVKFGGGREQLVLGHDRKGAGANAETGITALSLLAFLGAGHSHFEGEYRQTVQHGLEFLLGQQSANGSLAGDARLFAQMYCHAMGTLAISEALAVTGDRRLLAAVERAVEYSAQAQNSVDGGWRYQIGDRGDMSQFGWQVMALKSAELGGVAIPSQTTARMQQFLRRCSSGTHGGLAGYRPGHRATVTMTAEALLCRYFLYGKVDDDSAREATQLIMGELPGQSEFNLYYWYYATLALFQSGGETWSEWNRHLADTLVRSQNTQGVLAGSWDPTGVWCGYGGRVYSTAMATLCLEVYYRYTARH